MIKVLDFWYKPVAIGTPWEIAESLQVSTETVMQKAAEGGCIGLYQLEPTEAYVEWLEGLVSYTMPEDGPVMRMDEVAAATGHSLSTVNADIQKFKRMLRRILASV